jgi:hypothetical protein
MPTLNHVTNHEGVARTDADRARTRGKARGAAAPADGKAPPIDGRRAETKTVLGRPCPARDVVVESQFTCNASQPSNAEGTVCANAGLSSEAYCSYGVGPTACASCEDWHVHGPKCHIKPEIALGPLCSGMKTSKFSKCGLESVSLDRVASMFTKALQEWTTAAECASWSKDVCDFVGGTVKTDACTAGGPYCEVERTYYQECDSDADCAAAVYSWCCFSVVLEVEAWAAKMCDGVSTSRQALVSLSISPSSSVHAFKMLQEAGLWHGEGS